MCFTLSPQNRFEKCSIFSSSDFVIFSRVSFFPINFTLPVNSYGNAFSISFSPVRNSRSSSEIFMISDNGINSCTVLKSSSLLFHKGKRRLGSELIILGVVMAQQYRHTRFTHSCVGMKTAKTRLSVLIIFQPR